MNPNYPYDDLEDDESEVEEPMQMFRYSKSMYIGSILNNGFNIFITDIVNHGNTATISLECRPTENAMNTLYDAYDYLESTHYLNYLISKRIGGSLFYDEIDMRIEISEIPHLVSSKIIIIAKCDEVPHLAQNINIIHFDQRKFVDMLSAIPGCPIMARVTRSKSYYLPVLTYDITFSLNADSLLDFAHINENLFYDVLLTKYIEDAASEFYPEWRTDKNLSEFDKRLLRIHFGVEYSSKIIRITMMCCPAVFVAGDNILHKYLCIDTSIHTCSVDKIDSVSDPEDIPVSKFLKFIQNVSSSSCTQLLPINVKYRGIVPYCADENYHTHLCTSVLCTLYRLVASSENDGFSQVIPNFREVPSNLSYIKNYWVTDSPNMIECVDGIGMLLYGFVNLIPQYAGINIKLFYDALDRELRKILPNDVIIPKNLDDSSIIVEECYQSDEVCRYVIYEVIRTSNSTKAKNESGINNKKKRFRLFGGKK